MDLEDLFNRNRHRREHRSRDHENQHGHGEHRRAPFYRDYRDDNDQWRKLGDHQYSHHNDDLFNLSHLVPRLPCQQEASDHTAGIVCSAVIVPAVITIDQP